jgi:isocitrate/isopropylmalate dehydrogenase
LWYNGGEYIPKQVALRMKALQIAVIAGDGIGREVVPEGIRVLEAAGERFGFRCKWHEFDWSCGTYAKTGTMMPADGLAQLRPFDAIWSGVMMLRHLGQEEAADAVENAILDAPPWPEVRTPDIGGSVKTDQMSEAIVSALLNKRAS